MNRNPQFIVLYVSTDLNNTTSTRHTFALSQKSDERTSKSFQKYLVLHAKLATFVCLLLWRWCFYVTSRPNSFKYYSRSFFESSNGGKTSIGREFINLLDKCFPTGNKLRKIFNRNTVKLSYSCTPNMKQVIDGHNKAILKNAQNPEKINPKRCTIAVTKKNVH